MKELPYFKFDSAEWITGNITLESDEVQGLFINVCAHYWIKSGQLKLTEIKRRLSKSKATAFESLIKNGHIKVKNDIITISFLDVQLNERGVISQKNSENGKLGGRPKKRIESETKPTALILESETKPKKSNIEESRGEESKKEENRGESLTRDFEWFKSQIDEIWTDQLPTEKKINLGRAIQNAWEYLSADTNRLKVIEARECKQLVSKAFEFLKPEHNGQRKNTNSAEVIESGKKYSGKL